MLQVVYPGVRHRLARDAPEIADHVHRITKVLATFPYHKEV